MLVLLANVTVRNMCFCIRLAMRRDVRNIVEQPRSSVMWRLRCFRDILKRWRRIQIAMYRFGHNTYKPMVLWSDMPTLDMLNLPHSLKEFKKLKTVKKKQTPKGTQLKSKLGNTLIVCKRASSGTRGGPDLARTAEYPPAFCTAVKRAWAQSFS